MVACVVAYGRGIRTPFVFDDSLIAENASIRQLWPLIGDAENRGPLNPPNDLPTSGRPLVNFSLAINYAIGGLNSTSYHVFNLVMHCLSALLLMAIVRQILQLERFGERFAAVGDGLAFLTALVGLHPLQIETVVYVTQRTELMVGLCYFATFYASLRYWSAGDSSRRIWLALAVVASLAGMACKEVMVTAPVLILLFERTFIAGSFRGAWRNSWQLYAGLFATWLLLIWLNYAGPRSETAGFHLGVPAYAWWFTQAKAIWIYARLVVWPWPMLIHYAMPYLQTVGQAWPWLVATLLLVILILVLLWRRRPAGYVGAWVLLILSPTLVVPIVTEVIAERRMYLPLAAILTFVVVGSYGWLLQWAEKRRESEDKSMQFGGGAALAVEMVGVVVLAAIWMLVDVRRTGAYQDAIELWHEVAIAQPEDHIAFTNWGSALLAAEKFQEAADVLKHAIELKPDAYLTHDDLGAAYFNLGRYREAVDEHQLALQYKPNYPEALNNLGISLLKLGSTQEAIARLKEAIQFKPRYSEAYYNLGQAQTSTDDLAAAKESLQKAVDLEPHYADARQCSRLNSAADGAKRRGCSAVSADRFV